MVRKFKTIKWKGYYFALLLIVTAFFIKAAFQYDSLSNILAVSAVAFSILQSLEDKRVFYITFFPMYVLVGQLISLLIVEHGWIMIELGGLKTYPSYSLLFLALTTLVFHFTITTFSKLFFFKRIDPYFINKMSSNRALYYLPLIYLVVIFIPIIIYGSALSTTNGNRVVYYQSIPSIFNYFFQIKQFILPIAGLYFFKNKKLFYFYLAAVFVWNLLVGEKATGLWQSLYALYLPFFLIKYKEISTKKIILSLGACVSLIIAIILFTYIFVEKSGAYFLLDRISMQGQLWWYFFNEQVILNKEPHPFIEEFTNIYSGLIILMANAMPVDLFNSYMNRGVVLTSGYPTIFLYYFGLLWIFPTLFFAALFGLPVYFFSRSLYQGNILCLLISSKLLFSFNVLFARGDIESFFDYKLLVYLFLVIVFSYAPRLKF